MNDSLLTTLISVFAGGAGYLIVTFIMQPIIEYKKLRQEVLADLIFYGNVINADGLDVTMKNRLELRIEANRKSSARMTSMLVTLPCWYHFILAWKNQSPDVAATNLLGLSNTYEHEAARVRIDKIKQALNFDIDA